MHCQNCGLYGCHDIRCKELLEKIRDHRLSLCYWANKLADDLYTRGDYVSAPRLTADSESETIARWLQWCDPNGCHTAELADAEGFEPYDLETAWEALGRMRDEA